MQKNMRTCGHESSGSGYGFVCDLPAGHKGWHQQTTKLRDRTERTNWGDDGLAIWSSKDQKRRKEAQA